MAAWKPFESLRAWSSQDSFKDRLGFVFNLTCFLLAWSWYVLVLDTSYVNLLLLLLITLLFVYFLVAPVCLQIDPQKSFRRLEILTRHRHKCFHWLNGNEEKAMDLNVGLATFATFGYGICHLVPSPTSPAAFRSSKPPTAGPHSSLSA